MTSPATRSLNAFIQRDYATCVAAAAETTDVLPTTVGLVMLLALRRQGRADAAEQLGTMLVKLGGGMQGRLLLFLMLLDGALDPSQLVNDHMFGGVKLDWTADLDCQVHFYWGAKLLTEGNCVEAIAPLRRASNTDCKALERALSQADLETAEARAK